MKRLLTGTIVLGGVFNNLIVNTHSSDLSFCHSRTARLQCSSFDIAKNKAYASELIWFLGRNNFDTSVGMRDPQSSKQFLLEFSMK